MNSFLFGQTDVFERLKALRITICCILFTLITLGPYDSFYVETAPFLFQAKAPFPWFPNLGIHFWTLKYSVLILAACVFMDLYRKITRPLLALSWMFLSYYVTCFGTTYWITNTHLVFFTWALCFEPSMENNTPTVKQKEIGSFILAFSICYIALLYFQAGLSKWLSGGLEWFLEGNRIWTETVLLGTPFGKWLTQWHFPFKLMGIGTGFFELLLPFLLFFNQSRSLFAILAILFHLGTFLVMGISFWFLWALYPALFFTPWKQKTFYLRRISNP